MKQLLILLLLLPALAQSQTIVQSWQMNVNGTKATFWAQTGTAQVPVYTWTVSTDSADVLKVCYSSDSVWVRCHGMTTTMGQYKNPGSPTAQNYIYRFPRTPVVAATKTTSPKGGSIGLLLNGVPIYGLGNSNSWNGSNNTPQGSGVWNVEVGNSEGFVLDTTLGAHPQQQGAYHSHTTPRRFYTSVGSGSHSPLLGFAFDGYPVYGPYGYTSALNASSGVTRMTTGYSLRNITTRTTLPSGAAASQNGPAVSTQYPLGYYCEDYAWSAANGGTLDEYNGRFCVTPEYPAGTYAYFVSTNASGAATFPYYIGIQYYGTPVAANLVAPGNTATAIVIPASVTTCNLAIVLPVQLTSFTGTALGAENLLAWETASEMQAAHFVVERSEDGNNFAGIATLPARGNAATKTSYQFTDKDPLATGYYRLLMVDKNGQEAVSKVVAIRRQAQAGLSIQPTLLQGNELTLLAQKKGFDGQVRLLDAQGRLLAQRSVQMGAGNRLVWSVAQLVPGHYRLVAEDKDGSRKVQSLVKQ